MHARAFPRETTPRSRRENGNTLIMAMMTLAVLVMIAASTFQTITARFRSNFQTAGWHDALTSAENGVQYGLARLRNPLTNASGNLQIPSTVVNSLQWNIANLSPGNACVNGTVSGTTTDGSARIQLPTLTISHIGEGSSQFNSVVTVDQIPAANVINSGTNTWYRITSVGTVPLSGGSKVGVQKYDNYLRKLQLHFDGSGNVLGVPQAQRTVVAIAKPISIGSAALFGQSGINFTSQNININSYDSRSPAYSSGGTITNGVYSGGTYNPAKAAQNANIVTDDNPPAPGDSPGVINLSPTGAVIDGNVSTNSTAVQGGTNHVTGTITQDFYEALPSPPDPSLETGWNVSGTTTLTSGTSAASATRYEYVGGLSLSGQSALNIIAPASGQGYVEIWVQGTGNNAGLSIGGNASINIPTNVHVTFYIDGPVSIAGNGIVNASAIPGNVILYGNHDPTQSQSMTVNGNGNFAGVIYAPNASISVKGGGSNGDIYGAITGNNITFTGQTSLHYDQALSDAGGVIDYEIVSWHEDNVLVR